MGLIDEVPIASLMVNPNSVQALNRSIRNAAILHHLIVEEPYRGRGVADALLDYAERFAHLNGVSTLEIGVDAGNKHPLRQYLRKHYHDWATITHSNIDREFWSPGAAFPVIVRHYQAGAIVVYKNLQKQCRLLHAEENISEMWTDLDQTRERITQAAIVNQRFDWRSK
jgi:hypothetical protein